MATLKTIRKRIISVRNTQKITKAMKMVAAAKLRRAQTRLVKARPYAERMHGLVSNIAAFVPSSAHPLLAKREELKKVEYLILSSDRGLCGGFNGNLLRMIERTIQEEGKRCREVQFSVVGKKGRDFFIARRQQPTQVQTGVYDSFGFEQAVKLASDVAEGYVSGRFDEFYLAYNQFNSAISQQPKVLKLLPFEAATGGEPESKPEEGYTPEYIYEPGRQELLNLMLPKVLASVLYRAFLESMAGEHGARMAAMDAATNNSREMIRRLTLQSNRLRQAAITRELMDIVNGKEALG